MRLDDAGPKGDQQRMKRASEVMESFFKRVAIEQYRISVVAVYNGAKPVVVDTKDVEVVRNILGDLPMHHAFPTGKTDIFSGLEEAAKIAHPWKPRSTTVILVSDGDTVPATGMPKMPASVAHVLIVGIGDPRTGKFIDGRQSRQDTSTLRQVATRLSGTYHNGNEKHLSSEFLRQLTQSSEAGPLKRLSRREYALIACGVGASVFALLPLLLHYAGTRWRPGVPDGAPRSGVGAQNRWRQTVADVSS
jgi:Ca-activated chloride channel family protein